MRYREYQPCAALRRRVRCYWTLEGETAPPGGTSETIVPDGCPELVVHCGDRFLLRGSDSLELEPRSLLFGQIDRALRLIPTGRIEVVAARLAPAAAHCLVPAAVDQFSNRPLPLDAVWGTFADEIESRVRETPGGLQRIRVLEETLLARLGSSGDEDPAVEEALYRFARHRGAISVGALSKTIAISRRQLERRFRRRVGLTPKTYARVLRLQNVLRQLGEESQSSWAELSIAAGYFDQSHLTRDFKLFTGQSPAAFFASRHELSEHLTNSASGSLL